MDPFASGPLRIDPDDEHSMTPDNDAAPFDPTAVTSARRLDIETKQEGVHRLLETLNCEAAILLAPVHVAWFTSGMTAKGLFAESERPGIMTNGRQRWLVCANIDTARIFDEELDGLGFQLKEWSWETGRADLLYHLSAGRKVASDRPFPNIPQITDHLRPHLRVLTAYERDQYRQLGKILVHALEATARTIVAGQSEEEIAGQIAHRLIHRGVEPAVLSVVADDRGDRMRRASFTSIPIQKTCTLQATAQRHGLYVTASRSISFGPPPDRFRKSFEQAVRLAALFASQIRPDECLSTVKSAAQMLLANTEFEHEWRLNSPVYGAGRFAAEELRRFGHDERFSLHHALICQARIGPAAIVDTALVGERGPDLITPIEDWPIKRVIIRGQSFDIPDLWHRTE